MSKVIIRIHDDAYAGATAQEIERRKRAAVIAAERILRRCGDGR